MKWRKKKTQAGRLCHREEKSFCEGLLVIPTPELLPFAPRMHTDIDPSDEALLERAAAGDGLAFMSLYDRYAPRILGLLIKIMRNRADAEDALQIVSLELWRRTSAYNPALGSAATWILMIARARGIDCLRARGQPVEALDDAHLTSAPRQDSAPSSSPPSEHLSSAMQALPFEQRAAIELAFYRGLTREQAATALGVPVGTLKTRIRSGVRALASALSGADRGRG